MATVFRRRNVRADYDEQYLASLDAENKRFMYLVGANLKALREYTGMSVDTFIREIEKRYKYRTYRSSIQDLERNYFITCSLNYLNTFAMYWSIPLELLATVDYSIESNLPEHIKALKKENKFISAFQRKRVS